MKVNLPDLVVLGLVAQGIERCDALVVQAKDLVPDLWQPTADVVLFAIDRNISAGFLRLELTNGIPNRMELTASGAAHFRSLLLCDPGSQDTHLNQATEAIQFCFLDAVDPETAARVLSRFQDRLRERLAHHQQRCLDAPPCGRYVTLWRDLQRSHLESVTQFLAMISDEGDEQINGLHAAATI